MLLFSCRRAGSTGSSRQLNELPPSIKHFRITKIERKDRYRISGTGKLSLEFFSLLPLKLYSPAKSISFMFSFFGWHKAFAEKPRKVSPLALDLLHKACCLLLLSYFLLCGNFFPAGISPQVMSAVTSSSPSCCLKVIWRKLFFNVPDILKLFNLKKWQSHSAKRQKKCQPFING